jgi:N utilization substance protein A
VKIILSRTHPELVRRLFENEIPEIGERTIEIKALSREAGYRAKIAVSSIDLKVDAVGACVGVRGSRIKNIVDELGGERIDIVRWNDSLQVMIPNALQPAAIEEVFLYQRLGRAIVLVKEDQLSLAIGRRGQNVRLASKLVGWDLEIMTHDELNEGIEKAEGWFSQIPGTAPELVEAFIEEGFLSFNDLTYLEPAQLAEMAGVPEEQAEEMIAFAEEASERVEEETKISRAAEAEARAAGQVAVPARSAAAARAAEVFPEGDAVVKEEPKPTAESLWPDLKDKTQGPSLNAADVVGDLAPAQTAEALEGSESGNGEKP